MSFLKSKSIVVYFCILIVFILKNNRLDAQLTVHNDSVTNLINNYFIGEGINVFNIQYTTGDSIQLGSFNGSNSNLGIDSGTVIGTGPLIRLNPDSLSNGFLPYSSVEDQDLLSIANDVPALIGENYIVSNIYDEVIIEFDFVPLLDSIRCRFIFGSSEYPTDTTWTGSGWLNTSFNDVFAILLSGPGISGPYSAPPNFAGGAVNLAYVPNSDPSLPITVSTIHNGDGAVDPLNSEYFVSNPLSNLDSNSIGLINGFTVPIMVSAAVLAGDTFHMKIAIADGTDGALTSVLFLEANSFVSFGEDISTRTAISKDPSKGISVRYVNGKPQIELFNNNYQVQLISTTGSVIREFFCYSGNTAELNSFLRNTSSSGFYILKGHSMEGKQGHYFSKKIVVN